jgi:SecD/SecF fusion protein
LEFWETYKIEEMGNFLMAANETLKKTEVTVETVVKRFVECFINKRWRFSCNKKGNNLCKQYCWAVDLFWSFLSKNTATVNGYFRQRSYQQTSVM